MFKTIRYYLYYFTNIIKLGAIDIFLNRKRFKKFSSVVNDFKTIYNISIKSGGLKEIELEEIFYNDKINRVIIENRRWRQGNVTLNELYCLSWIARQFNPKIIFEIGTFDGRTTLHFALNSPDHTQIHTLDIPYEELNQAILKFHPGDEQLINKNFFKIGQAFLNREESEKITQHLSDSAKFDYNPFNNKVDLFFVDGAHSFEYIKSDTDNALGTLTNNGIILWHDYGNILDVTNFLNDLSSSIPIYRIKNTSLAIYSKSLTQN